MIEKLFIYRPNRDINLEIIHEQNECDNKLIQLIIEPNNLFFKQCYCNNFLSHKKNEIF